MHRLFDVEDIRYAIAEQITQSASLVAFALLNHSFFRPAMFHLWVEIKDLRQMLCLVSLTSKRKLEALRLNRVSNLVVYMQTWW